MGLGELLAKRSFAAGGEINPLSRQQRKAQAIYIEDEKLVQDDVERPWQPRSVLAVLDGANSIRWAWVLLELGEEDQIHEYIDWFISKARARPQKLYQLWQFWDAASWKMCMRMRSGKLFNEAASAIMADVDMFHEYMAKEPVTDTPASASSQLANQVMTMIDSKDALVNHMCSLKLLAAPGMLQPSVHGKIKDGASGTTTRTNPRTAQTNQTVIPLARDNTGLQPRDLRYPTM